MISQTMKAKLYDRNISYMTDINAEDLASLLRINRKLDRIAVDDCNGNPITEIEYREGKMYRYEVQDEKRARENEKAWDRLIKKAYKIAQSNKWELDHQGDPRGSILKLKVDGRDLTDVIC